MRLVALMGNVAAVPLLSSRSAIANEEIGPAARFYGGDSGLG